MRVVSLLPILLVIAGISADTIFRANGTLTCNYHWPTWCFSVQLWEKDVSFLLNMDDLIAKEGVYCRQSDTMVYDITGSQDWDGIHDEFFESQIYIIHNCTYLNDILQVTQKTFYTRVGLPETSVTFDVDVTHRGTKVSSLTMPFKLSSVFHSTLIFPSNFKLPSKSIVKPNFNFNFISPSLLFSDIILTQSLTSLICSLVVLSVFS